MNATGSTPPRRYSAGLIAMIIFGLVLLLPGVCSLVFIGGGIWETASKGQAFDLSGPFASAAVIIWIVSFVISAGGIALIVVARKHARAPR